MQLDDNFIKLITLMLTTISTLGLAWVGYLTLQANNAAEIARRTAEVNTRKAAEDRLEVRDTLVRTEAKTIKKLEALDEVARATHTLVNSNYGASLMATLNALKAVRTLTVNEADRVSADAAVAEAQRLYDDHLARQAVVDNVADNRT